MADDIWIEISSSGKNTALYLTRDWVPETIEDIREFMYYEKKITKILDKYFS